MLFYQILGSEYFVTQLQREISLQKVRLGE